MMAYGGCGPVHAASYGGDARRVQTSSSRSSPRCIRPYGAGSRTCASACGTRTRSLPVAPEQLEAIYARMEEHGARELPAARRTARSAGFERWVEARYRRQVHTVRVRAPASIDAAIGSRDRARLSRREYERLFGPGSALKDAGIELRQLRRRRDRRGRQAGGRDDERRGPPPTPRTRAHDVLPAAARAWWIRPSTMGASLGAGAEIAGPAVIEHPGTTIVLHRGTARPDRRVAATPISLPSTRTAPTWPDEQHAHGRSRHLRGPEPSPDEISEEMGIQYMRCSGSNVLITGNDAAAADHAAPTARWSRSGPTS